MSQESNTISILCNFSYDEGKKDGAIEELEKLKVYINKNSFIDFDDIEVINTYTLNEFINSRILELKGEKK